MNINSNFDKLSQASTELLRAQEGPLTAFTKEAGKVADAVDAFFQAGNRLIDTAEPGMKRAITAIVEESKTLIISKLNEYVTSGEGSKRIFDREVQKKVVGTLGQVSMLPAAIFSNSLDHLIYKFKEFKEAKNTIEWKKVEASVDVLQRLQQNSPHL